MANAAAMIAPTTRNPIETVSFNDVGSWSSLLPMSAEKRFKIRPSGLVSKNSTFARRTASVMVSCNLRDALIVRLKAKNDRSTERQMIPKPSDKITDKKVGEDCSSNGLCAHRPMKAIVTRSVHCEFNSITVNFHGTQYGIYIIYYMMLNKYC